MMLILPDFTRIGFWITYVYRKMTVQYEENWRLRRRLAHTLILSKACWSHKDLHARMHTHTHTHNLLDITVSDLKMRMCRVVEILSHHHHLPFIERWENAKNYGLYVWCCSSFFNERWLRGKDIKQTLLALGKIHWIKAKVWKLISKFWPKEPRRGQKWLCGHIEGRVHWIP